MDVNGMPVEGYPMTELPMGFAMSLAMNERAMKRFSNLTETEREHLIMRCKDVNSKEEMQKIVDSLAPDESISSIKSHLMETENIRRPNGENGTGNAF